MLRNKVIFHSLNIVFIIIAQSILQDAIRINNNSVLLYLPLSICNILFFELVEAFIVNSILVLVFCSIFSNGILINIFLMVMLLILNKKLKERIYVERVEIFLIYLFGFIFILNTFFYFISQYLNGYLIDISILFKNVFAQFILSSIFGIFIYEIIAKENKYLERLKKGRNLKEE